MRFATPLLREHHPDPAIIKSDDPDGAYYLVSTTFANDLPNKFPLRRSTDLRNWTDAGFVFPERLLPSWARAHGEFWAPEIHRAAGGYVCYFCARTHDGVLAIGAAKAPHVLGPWRDIGAPLVHDAQVGMIDPHRFRDDDGRQYLYWKEDGNGLAPAVPTVIYANELSPDGLSLIGARHEVLQNDQPWEGHVVEGPWVVRRQERYYLFYSGNAFHTEDYATGVARASSPFGPFEKCPAPILQSCERWKGPGHGCVVEHPDEGDYFVYHAWEAGRVYGPHPRLPMMRKIAWDTHWPILTTTVSVDD